MGPRWRWLCVVLATLVAATSCDDTLNDHGAGGGASADAGRPPVHGGKAQVKPSGSSGAPAVISCGAATCRATAMFAACCVDATHGTCGVENETVGVACGVPAIADPDCPPVRIVFGGNSISAQGCCTSRGVCGGFNLGSPCALVPLPNDDDGGDQAAPRACRPSD